MLEQAEVTDAYHKVHPHKSSCTFLEGKYEGPGNNGTRQRPHVK